MGKKKVAATEAAADGAAASRFPQLEVILVALGVDRDHLEFHLNNWLSLYPDLEPTVERVREFLAGYLTNSHFASVLTEAATQLAAALREGKSEVVKNPSTLA